MKALAATESDFQNFVLGGESAIAEQIVGDAGLRRDRLGIYFDAYRLRLIEVLGHDFDVLRRYVGDEVFGTMARGYIACHPSAFRNVRWFGHRFAEFLGGDPRFAAQAVLGELASLEWNLGLAFDAPDAPVISFAELAAQPPEAWAGMCFVPHPCLRLLAFRSNAPAIWNAIKACDAPIAPEHHAGETAWAIWRSAHSSYFSSLQADEAWAVRAFCQGRSFPEICEGICEWVEAEEAPARAAGYLRGWVDQGWIAALK